MTAVFATKPLVASKSFNLKHAFRPVFSLNPAISKNIYHPLHEKALEKLKEEERPQLIIDIVATIKRTSPKAVVRNRSKRRIREATHQVLKENGYSKDGKAEDGNKKDLVGTLSFFTTIETVLTPWIELKEEVRRGVVKWIALRQKESGLARNSGREDARQRRGEQPVENRYAPYRGGTGRVAGLEAGGGWGYEKDARKGLGVRAGGESGRAGGNVGTVSREYLNRGGAGERGGIYPRGIREGVGATIGGAPSGNKGIGLGEYRRGTISGSGGGGERGKAVQVGGREGGGKRWGVRENAYGPGDVRSGGRGFGVKWSIGNTNYIKFRAKDPAQR